MKSSYIKIAILATASLAFGSTGNEVLACSMIKDPEKCFAAKIDHPTLGKGKVRCFWMPSKYNERGREVGGDKCETIAPNLMPYPVNSQVLVDRFPEIYSYEPESLNGNKPNFELPEDCAFFASGKCKIKSIPAA